MLLLAYPAQAQQVHVFGADGDSEPGSTLVLDTATDSVLATIDSGADDIAGHPDGTRLFVATYDNIFSDFTYVRVIETGTYQTLAIGGSVFYAFGLPHMAVHPDGTRLYLSRRNFGVEVLDTATMSSIVSIYESVGSVKDLVIHPDGTRLYLVGDYLTAVIDTTTDSIVTYVNNPGSVWGAAVSPDGARLYVTHGSGVTVIDPTTNTITATIPFGSWTFAVAVGTASNRVYVVDRTDDSVYVVDALTDTVIANIPVGQEPRDVAVHPDGSRVYVGNGGLSGSGFSVIDTATNTVVDTIIDGRPQRLAVVTVPPAPADLCGASPATGCASAGKAVLAVKEKVAGKEKLIAKFLKGSQMDQADFGNPIPFLGTSHALCVYDSTDALVGSLNVNKAGLWCAYSDCWRSSGGDPPDGKGYKYKDANASADGVSKITIKGGDAGKSKAILKASNRFGYQPLGIAAALAGHTNATMQLVTSDASCISATLTDIKKNDVDFFKGK